MKTDSVQRSHRGIVLTVILLLAVSIGAAIYAGIVTRIGDRTRLEQAVEEASVPTVSVVSPKAGAESEEIQLPGNVQAFVEAGIYARTAGYLKHWHADIGSHVKSGQLLAEIETPEVDQQLEQSRADLEKAEADVAQAQIKAKRWVQLLKDRAVSSEESDEASADLTAKKATADARRASVRRLEKMQSFEKITAPFSGVITSRNVDTGDLIDAGGGSQPRELFHLAALDKMRVFVALPGIYAEAANSGGEATLTLDQYPGRMFKGQVARNANAIDMNTRTLKVEVDVDNADGSLMSGAYAMVHFKVGSPHGSDSASVTIPANTLLFRAEGPSVALLRGGHAELVPIKIGRDYGKTLEIVSGLKPGDQLVLDPSDSLITGMPLRTAGKPVSGE
ncbi:MAG: efflux transporter, family, subunit [Verrucomicrobiaceae bacterium]|nr:efflux transporter, family, subunit [Verrucomicrobiaceae bacterium]